MIELIASVNWTEWQQNLMSKSFQPYETVIGILFWVLLFTFIIGYVYMKQQSYVAAAITALIIIAVFGNYLTGMDSWTNLIVVFLSLVFSGLFIYLLAKNRRG